MERLCVRAQSDLEELAAARPLLIIPLHLTEEHLGADTTEYSEHLFQARFSPVMLWRDWNWSRCGLRVAGERKERTSC